MIKKQYSFLDHRRNTFDTDFEQFCKSTLELNVSFILHPDKLSNHAIGEKKYRIGVCCLLTYFSLLLQYQLKNFMETTLGKVQNTESALMVLKQFERSVTSFGMKSFWHQADSVLSQLVYFS